MTMVDDVVTTGVDDLLHYLQGKDRIPLQDVANVLNVPVETVQAWVDFLVEEKILGIEYKFTKPFIYMNKETKPEKGRLLETTAVPIEQIKQEYEDRAKTKQIPAAKIRELWLARVRDALANKKEYFIEQAKHRRAESPEDLWHEYQTDLLARC
jgi:predicted ArsR family transcriptional regulator